MPFGPEGWSMEWDPVEERHELVPDGWTYYPDFGRIKEKKRKEEERRHMAEQFRERKELENLLGTLGISIDCGYSRGYDPTPEERRNCRWRCVGTIQRELCDEEYEKTLQRTNNKEPQLEERIKPTASTETKNPPRCETQKPEYDGEIFHESKLAALYSTPETQSSIILPRRSYEVIIYNRNCFVGTSTEFKGQSVIIKGPRYQIAMIKEHLGK